MLAVASLVPASATASTGADAWMSAQMVHRSHAAAIGEAALRLSDGGTEREIRELRRTVGIAVGAIDRLEVHACFRVWWSYVRSSFVLFDQALVGLEANDFGQVQAATTASRYLSSMAASLRVDCSRSDPDASTRLDLSSRDPLPLVGRVDLPSG